MLKLILGTDWKENTNQVLTMLASDVANKQGKRILIVPETISHSTERSLCQYAGDAASRYAEVLSFSRLPDRLRDAIGFGEEPCMDKGGRMVAMAAAAVQLHSKLKAYASVETRPEFLIDLLSAVDEFKCCCIGPQDLMQASKASEGSLAQKLEELSLLLEAYDALCARGKRDPRDRLSWLLEQMEDCDFASDYVFYFNGFSDFTGQQLGIIKHLIAQSALVVVSLNCDEPGSDEPAFEKAGETAATLLRFAAELGVSVQLQQVQESASPLGYARKYLFRGAVTQQPNLSDKVRLFQADSLTQECDAAAQLIMERVRSGARYRDIRVVCADAQAYKNTLKMCFDRYGIPTYLSGTEDILDMPIIHTVLAALEVAACGFDQKTVMRYLRSHLSPLDVDTCDRLENYAFMWNIRGDRWKQTWTQHPDGLGFEMTDQAAQRLQALNTARETALTPLVSLEAAFAKAKNLQEQVAALYGFLEDIQLDERLSQMAQVAAQDGEHAMIQVFGQLWEILLGALEQLYDVLGESIWNTENFVKLLKLLLSQYDVGTIPPVLDAVTVGPVSGMRFQQATHLIILGAADGNFPNYAKTGSILTDQERTQLRQMGMPLTGGALDGLQSEFADIYNIFCGARETVCMSCPGGQPSYIYKRLLTMVGKEQPVDTSLGSVTCNQLEASAYLVRNGTPADAQSLALDALYAQTQRAADHTLGTVSKAGVRALYGDCLNLSATKVDTVADCRLAYFLKYGIKAKEWKEATIDPAEFGTYVHDVLEKTARQIKEQGGFHHVTLGETLEIANHYAQIYAQERFSQVDSERLLYLFSRNTQELEWIVTELWEELQNSTFEPAEFELAFGNEGQMDYIHFNGKDMQAQLEGKVDRVDVWDNGHQKYFRVVDYKTGKKDFDYCDVYNGLGLQMFLYLFALQDNGGQVLGDAAPAGVQYFPARVPIVKSDGTMTQEEIKDQRIKDLKRKGLILQDDEVLQAMEDMEKPYRMYYTRKKDGSVSGYLADREQLQQLKTYIFKLLGRIVDDISSGCVTPNPYTRGDRHNPCRFCPYGAVCHPVYVENRRNYKEMNAPRFWESIGKELEPNG